MLESDQKTGTGIGHFQLEGKELRVSWLEGQGVREILIEPSELWILVCLEGCGELLRMSSRVLPGNVVAGGRKARVLGLRTEGRHRVVILSAETSWLAKWTDLHTEQILKHGRVDKPLSAKLRSVAEELVTPPMQGPLADGWYQAKALELIVHVLQPPNEGFFCERQKRLAHDRVEKVKQILLRDLESPPGLSEIAREAGCSPHYLSRTFSQETGTTISRFLRDARLDAAAAILRRGKSNVTEAAMEVGYSSLSHFSKAFAERFGVCPCVFPLTPATRPVPKQKLPEPQKRDSSSHATEPQKPRSRRIP